MYFFSFRARAEKGIARHIDVSSVVWTLAIFDWLVLGMRMQVILDSAELKNVCACARLWRRNPILSFVRGDFLFCPFDVLFVWFEPRNGP